MGGWLMRGMAPVPRAAVAVLTLACCSLGAVIALEANTPPGTPGGDAATPATAPHAAIADVPPTFALPPLATFSAVSERPLFSPDRRPPPQASADATGTWSSLVVAGIIVTPDARQVLIAHGTPPAIVHLQEGQAVDGWTVRSIAVDRIVLANGGEQHELRLFAEPKEAGAPRGGNRRGSR